MLVLDFPVAWLWMSAPASKGVLARDGIAHVLSLCFHLLARRAPLVPILTTPEKVQQFAIVALVCRDLSISRRARGSLRVISIFQRKSKKVSER